MLISGSARLFVVRQFLRREILGRYRGSMLGLAWSFLTPLLMLAVYTFVFAGVLHLRWPEGEEAGGLAFALRLFAGLMVYQLFAEVTSRASVLILEQPHLVKKVVFPLEILPLATLGAALFHFLLSLAILLAAAALTEPALPTSALLAPLSVLPLLPLLLGLGWLLAALGVYVRETTTIVNLGVSLMLFLSPVFYTVAALPPRWRFWMELNPLTPAIENFRRMLFAGQAPDWGGWWLGLAAGIATALAGAWVFSKARRGFADVI